MGLRDRLLHRIGVSMEPAHVEKASRRERWKRQAWMHLSTVLSFAAVGMAAYALSLVAPAWPPIGTEGYHGVVVAVVLVVLALAIDILFVFPWGYDRFDLVAPWQFRDEQDKEGHP